MEQLLWRLHYFYKGDMPTVLLLNHLWLLPGSDEYSDNYDKCIRNATRCEVDPVCATNFTSILSTPNPSVFTDLQEDR